jgi:hypothetical protein|tara:strand:+ start:133 stop:348 length:216 start_codon:yes stop_codon:yes gene_type:complete
MFAKVCSWFNGQKTLVGVATLIGGLHMIATESQPVLGVLDIPAITLMGKEIGVQTILGGFLTLAGACVLIG